MDRNPFNFKYRGDNDLFAPEIRESITKREAKDLTALATLNGIGGHIYAGTVLPNVIAKRRAKNKRARRSRQINRRR